MGRRCMHLWLVDVWWFDFRPPTKLLAIVIFQICHADVAHDARAALSISLSGSFLCLTTTPSSSTHFLCFSFPSLSLSPYHRSSCRIIPSISSFQQEESVLTREGSSFCCLSFPFAQFVFQSRV